MALQRTAHKRELARSKDEVAQLLATAEASSVPVDEELVRRRYVKEIERIKVQEANVLNFRCILANHHSCYSRIDFTVINLKLFVLLTCIVCEHYNESFLLFCHPVRSCSV